MTATDSIAFPDSYVKPNIDQLPENYTLAGHQFIETVFGAAPSGFLELTFLAPEGVKLYPKTIVKWANLPDDIAGGVDPAMPGIMAMNERGYNCYFGAAVRGVRHEPEQRISDKTGNPYTFYPRGKAADAFYVTALWADIDEPGDSGYQRAIGGIVPPSIVVQSGGGFHAYWLLVEPVNVTDDVTREMVKRTLKGIALAIGSDTKVADMARIMRIPGTVNTKPGRGTRCEVISFLPGYYHYEEMERTYAPLAAPRVPTVSRAVPVSASAGMPRWVETYLNNGAAQGERNNKAYAAARALLDNGFTTAETERHVRQRALADGLGDDEVTVLIHSAEAAPRSAPDMPHSMSMRMGAADRLLRGRGGAK